MFEKVGSFSLAIDIGFEDELRKHIEEAVKGKGKVKTKIIDKSKISHSVNNIDTFEIRSKDLHKSTMPGGEAGTAIGEKGIEMTGMFKTIQVSISNGGGEGIAGIIDPISKALIDFQKTRECNCEIKTSAGEYVSIKDIGYEKLKDLLNELLS